MIAIIFWYWQECLLISSLHSSAPIAAFRKKDKQEKEDIAPDRILQGLSRPGGFTRLNKQRCLLIMLTCVCCWLL